MTLVLIFTIINQVRNKQAQSSKHSFISYIQVHLSHSSSIHTRVFSERDIVLKALFVYPSRKGELSLWEKSQIRSTINYCIRKVGVTLVRCEGDFPPCEEEWCTLGVWRFELHLQRVWFSGLKSQVVYLGSGRRSGGPNHDKSPSLNLSLPISLLLFQYLYSLHYTASYIVLIS